MRSRACSNNSSASLIVPSTPLPVLADKKLTGA
jgi:hypothetical protein